MKTSVLNIKGMGCSGCADTVTKALTELEGVSAAEVDFASGKAKVSYEETPV